MNKIIYNSWLAKLLLAFGSKTTIMLFGWVLTKLPEVSQKTRNHEGTHVQQFVDCLSLGFIVFGLLVLITGSMWWLILIPFTFYILYGLEWIISWAYHLAKGDARAKRLDESYHATSFEMEAFAHEKDSSYNMKRKWLAHFKYYGKL